MKHVTCIGNFRLKAELLKRDDQLRFFTPGQHRQLSMYLSQINYLDSSLKLRPAQVQ